MLTNDKNDFICLTSCNFSTKKIIFLTQTLYFMKSKLLLILLFSFGLVAFSSIDSNAQFLCGHDHHLLTNEKKHPGYLETVQKTFNDAKQKSSLSFRSDETYVIDVVVHIVYQNEEQNLHDSLIYDQIQVLNEDFSRSNADTTDTRDIFKDRVGNPGIQFNLKEIVRVPTQAIFESTLTGLPDNVKQSPDGSVAHNTSKHMNIWVCKLEPLNIFGIDLGQILGYAYPPAGLSNWPDESSAPSQDLDGVVIDYRVFGRNTPYSVESAGQTIQGYGRTTVHEVGHYLGLRHIWGDELFGDGCAVDDGLEDTPNQASSSEWSCDHTQNTCTDSTGEELPDMIENYMDYSNERCMNSFTQGQVDIMRAVLEGPRRQLIDSTNSLKRVTNIVDFSIFPNPTNQNSISVNIEGNNHNMYLNIFNHMGQLVMGTVVQSHRNQIEIDGLTSGMYLLQLVNKSTGNHLGSRKLLVR